MNKPAGFLIDLDGVLYVEDEPIPGAREAILWLRENQNPLRFVTNTTRRSRAALVEKLRRVTIDVESEEIVSTCVVAARWLKREGISKIQALVLSEALADFSDLELVEESPEAVVIGDLGGRWDYDVLNSAFRALKGGARLVALQKNRFWQRRDGLALDAGPFVAALEYAADTEAVVIGKPNRAYFEMAVEDLSLPPERVAMVGDDLDTDIQGARAAGLKTVLVETGKSSSGDVADASVKPDWILESIADLPSRLGT